ncbi:hypothetical protein F383_15502 [Gossypium arboreum]|uniref:Uncharacterized protein n=1 Tax=Gossypium arboreum TaxID=29729 RepID=A0A0B0MFC7_GOSAR|nr:hypothetical protein F383_15502 [Gossypium arboreum]
MMKIILLVFVDRGKVEALSVLVMFLIVFVDFCWPFLASC